MTYFCVNYTYVDDAASLDQHRPAHREFLRNAPGLVAAGPHVEVAPPSALLIFTADSAQELATMLDQDPFKVEGLIAQRTIQQWNPALGVFAA